MSFAIITDTSANIPHEKTLEWDISIIPFTYYISGKELSCVETEQFDGKQFYDAMRGGSKVTTSQIPPQRFIDFMRPILEEGKDILYVGMSSGISGAFQSANTAMRHLLRDFPERKIRLVDSLGASLGEGLLVIRAKECRDEGLSIDETAELLEAVRPCVYQVFTVEDLVYLRRSGRISNFSRAIGSTLNIKPLLKGNEEGKIVSFAKVLGRKRSITALADKYASLVKDPASQTVYIAHADCEEDAQTLAALLREKAEPKEVFMTCYEPVTGSHVGPGALALFFLADTDVRSK